MYIIVIVLLAIAYLYWRSRGAAPTSAPTNTPTTTVCPQCTQTTCPTLTCPQTPCPQAPSCPAQAPCPIVTCPTCPNVVCPTCEKCPALSVPESIANGNIVEGGVYHCVSTGAVYKIENGVKRWYPNPTIYNKYGAPEATSVDCEWLEQIPGGRNFW